MPSGVDKIYSTSTLSAHGFLRSDDYRVDLSATIHSFYYKLATNNMVRIEVYEAMLDGDDVLVGTFNHLTGTGIKNLGLKGGTRIFFKIIDTSGSGGTVTFWFLQGGADVKGASTYGSRW